MLTEKEDFLSGANSMAGIGNSLLILGKKSRGSNNEVGSSELGVRREKKKRR